MNHLVILKADQAIRKLFGWELFAGASNIGKLFKRSPLGAEDESAESCRSQFERFAVIYKNS
jgi:hypothetical protein